MRIWLDTDIGSDVDDGSPVAYATACDWQAVKAVILDLMRGSVS